MSNSASAKSVSASMQDVEDAGERKEQQTQAASTGAAAAVVPSAADARAARLARRSQLRDEAERDATEQERRRMEALATKAAAREARRVSTLALQLQSSCGPAQRLFTDGIAICLGFLSLPDFLSAARSCKPFRAAAVKVKSLGNVELCDVAGPRQRDDRLASLATSHSPFRHLVKSIRDSSVSDALLCRNGADRYGHSSGWDRKHFALLLELSSLTALSMRIDLVHFEYDDTPVKYPAQLQHVVLDIGCNEIWMGGDGIDWSPRGQWDAAPVLRGLAACASLTTLNLRIFDDKSIEIATALSYLKQLKHFTLRSWHTFRFTRALIHVLGGLVLESLSLVCYDHDNYGPFEWDAHLFGVLFAEPNPLSQLPKLTLEPFSWRDPWLSLSSFHRLSNIEPDVVSISVLPELASHPKLRTLRLVFDGQWESDMEYPDEEEEELDGRNPAVDERLYIRAAVVLPHLQPLTALTNLHVEHVTFTAADFALLCQTLPQLEVLTLYDDALVSFGGLASLSRLRELTLSLAKHAEIADVAEHVGQCKSLEKLRLDKMSPALSDAAQLALKPPSTLLPLLKSFECSAH